MPKNIYILASMNSVDKAVAPLDSALERRFNKINVMPNIIHLIEVLQTDSINDLISKFQISDDSPDASEVAVLLLYKINYIFATTFGKDFELGQSNFYSLKNYIDEDSKFFEIAKIWEQFIFPQIQDKFISRPDEILSILRLNNETEDIPEDFAYKFKIKPINLYIDDINTFNQLELISLVELWKRDINSVKNSLKYIAGF
jgi:hypothetical protein